MALPVVASLHSKFEILIYLTVMPNKILNHCEYQSDSFKSCGRMPGNAFMKVL